MNKIMKCLLVALAFVSVMSGKVSALIVPENDSNADFFYVFGSDGRDIYGADDYRMEIFIDVPADDSRNVVISVYDADTGDKRDWRSSNDNPWNTKTEFTLFGEDELLSRTFGEDSQANQAFTDFGPFKKTQGQKIGGAYRFRLLVEGVEGDDANLFKVKVEPSSAAVFSYKITFRLAPDEGKVMNFYPSIPADIQELIVGNYDLDREGGISELVDPATKIRYNINDSTSGQWSETRIPLTNRHGQHFDYMITKGTQRSGNAGLKFMNEKGELLPIYFSASARPARIETTEKQSFASRAREMFGLKKDAPQKSKKEVRKESRKEVKKEADIKTCNTFTFDGRSSYDVDKQDLAYVWDFGDGTSSEEAVSTHTYERGGYYTVSLTVTDTSGLQCDTAMATQSVYVNESPVPVFESDDVVCVAETTAFNAAGTMDNTPETLSYMWDFGDGTKGEGVNVSKAYAKGGTYNVRLYVDDNDGTTCSQSAAERVVKVNTPPTADAGEDKDLCLNTQEGLYSVTFDASKSADADGNALDYAWDFGDGTAGEGQFVTHVYEKGGDYIARLVVNDGSIAECNAASDTVKVSLNRAPVAEAGENKRVCIGNELAFNGGESRTESGLLKYLWDFGDGTTAPGKAVVHTYVKGGMYSVVLKVDNGSGTMCSSAEDKMTVLANTPPTLKIDDISPSCVGDEVVFAADAKDADGDALKYMWDFGDGTTSTDGARVTHKYASGGDYKVSLMIDDGKGFSCSKASVTTLVHVNTPPVADAGLNLACCVDQQTMFDGTGSTDADGDVLKYFWSFGDGAVSDKAETEHVYARSGVYDVTLKVDDGSGTACSSSTTGFKATVNTKPIPVIKIK